MTSAPRQNHIVFLHGLGRTHYSFMSMARTMKKAGYDVTSLHYPSLTKSVDGCADYIARSVQRNDIWNHGATVHFVTHSMGGLVLDSYLRRHKDTIPEHQLGRVVMLAPPWGGSEIADFWSKIPLYHWIYGPAGAELTTHHRNISGITPHYPLGVIAGTRSRHYLDAWFIFNDQNDGRVRVHHTHIPGMTDHITRSVSHSGILNSKETHKQALHFLQTGRFDHDAA